MLAEGRLLDFILVGAVALIGVGPKDLPIVMRKVGQLMAGTRSMAASFRAGLNELARQSELDELRKEIGALGNARPLDAVADHADPDKVLADIHAGLAEAGAQFRRAGPDQPPAAEPPLAATVEAVRPAPAGPERSLRAIAGPEDVASPARKARARTKSAGAAS